MCGGSSTKARRHEGARRKCRGQMSVRNRALNEARAVILRYSEESGPSVELCRCFGIPQHDKRRSLTHDHSDHAVEQRLVGFESAQVLDEMLGEAIEFISGAAGGV